MALPRPAPQRLVFRPARRVSWGTRIFAALVLILAVATIGAFLEVVLPQRIASLGQMDAGELALARKGAADVNTSLVNLWAELAKGSMSLPSQRLTQDLAQAKNAERSANDALTHVRAAEVYLTQADGIPFQLHAPAFVAPDRQYLQHLEQTLTGAIRMAHAASLQLTLAQHLSQDSQAISGTLDPSLNAHNWSVATNTATDLAADLQPQQASAANAETLLDPLWGKWIDAMLYYVNSAKQYAFAAAAGQTQSAQQLAQQLAAARNQLAAAQATAQNNAPAWQAQKIQPLLDKMAKDLAGSGA